MEKNRFLDIFIMVMVSFFAAATVGLNRYATDRAKGNEVNQLVIISEILVHGFSGFLVGLICTRIVSDIYILCAICGVGGMIGQKLLYVVVRSFMSTLTTVKIEKEDVEDE